jgi:multidrug efflux system membrane fusion protein
MGNEGNFVWVLNSDNKVSKHLVKTGIQDSQTVVIAPGFPQATAWSPTALTV